MIDDEEQAAPPRRLRYFVRRVPDGRRRPGRRRSYEVGTFVVGPGHGTAAEPVVVVVTPFPTTVLVEAGVHPVDAAEYVDNADRAWTGGIGPWRGNYPFEVP